MRYYTKRDDSATLYDTIRYNITNLPQIAEKSDKKAPQRPQETPRTRRGPKKYLNTQEIEFGSQGWPKAPQWSQLAPKETPRDPKGTPKDSQKDPKGTSKDIPKSTLKRSRTQGP